MKDKIKYSPIPGICAGFLLLLSGCTEPFKNDYVDNSPTSGKLKVYYDEGLQLHIKNQAYTFESQYPNAKVELYSSNESEAIQALFNDSCKEIVIPRLLGEREKKSFESKNMYPKFSAVAKTGVALITNLNTPVDSLSYGQVIDLLSKPFMCKDSISNSTKISVLIDGSNSSVSHYLVDSLLKGGKLSPNCGSLKSTIESINYVAKNKNTIAFIDFAWLSDVDDSISKANRDKIKFVAIGKNNVYAYPGQSSFKLGTYAFTRTVYVIRNAGEFSLAKGLESFVAGPKGQILFLKQGLLPERQQERNVQVNFEPMKVN
jgi:phosphate transport system substrate-binding protein